MTFFNKKEEVMDIELTRFGRNCLARGVFSPEYYQFFDDDIIYNSSFAGFSEHQNDAEKRILEDTPRFRTQPITFPIEKAYSIENDLIKEGVLEKFKPISRTAEPTIQERILLYPMNSQDIQTQESPRFNIESYGAKFKGDLTYLNLTSSGIIKNIPQINVEPLYTLRIDREDTKPTKMFNQETYVDLTSLEARFLDNSAVIINPEHISISIEEINSHYGIDNFEIEIYEVVEKDGEDDSLIRIESLEEINKYFHIKTDEDAISVPRKEAKSRNYYRYGES